MIKAIRRGQTEEMVYDKINSMAPYFGIDRLSNYWLLPRLPRVTLVDKYPRSLSWAGYDFVKNEILIELGYEDKPSVILHEVGHWWHKMLNPRLFRIFSRLNHSDLDEYMRPRSYLTYLSETIALYSEALFSNEEGLRGFDMLGLTLPGLVRMDFANAMLRGEEFGELSTDLHKLCRDCDQK